MTPGVHIDLVLHLQMTKKLNVHFQYYNSPNLTFLYISQIIKKITHKVISVFFLKKIISCKVCICSNNTEKHACILEKKRKKKDYKMYGYSLWCYGFVTININFIIKLNILDKCVCSSEGNQHQVNILSHSKKCNSILGR